MAAYFFNLLGYGGASSWLGGGVARAGQHRVQNVQTFEVMAD